MCFGALQNARALWKVNENFVGFDFSTLLFISFIHSFIQCIQCTILITYVMLKLIVVGILHRQMKISYGFAYFWLRPLCQMLRKYYCNSRIESLKSLESFHQYIHYTHLIIGIWRLVMKFRKVSWFLAKRTLNIIEVGSCCENSQCQCVRMCTRDATRVFLFCR